MLADLGVTGVSTIVADADALSFARFDMRRWLGEDTPRRAARQFGVPHTDAITALIEDGVLVCRGTLAGGANFGCSAEGGWLLVFGLQIEILASFRGPLRAMIDNSLLAMREYRVTSVDVFAGTTVLRFECPVLPLTTLLPDG